LSFGELPVNKLFLTLALLFAPLLVLAQDNGGYVVDKDYDLITPEQRTLNKGQIEVVEFFAYSCSHCYNFEPLIEQWKKTLPADVDFVPSPAVWSAANPLFAAIHVDQKRLASEAEIRAVFVANGVSASDFDAAYNSFGVGSQLRQASARLRGAGVTGTPELMVAGKYRVSTRKAGSQAGMLKIADFLITKERAAQAAIAAR
jgi:protein dithiol oxidoreductase (disulfide-forming)